MKKSLAQEKIDKIQTELLAEIEGIEVEKQDAEYDVSQAQIRLESIDTALGMKKAFYKQLVAPPAPVKAKPPVAKKVNKKETATRIRNEQTVVNILNATAQWPESTFQLVDSDTRNGIVERAVKTYGPRKIELALDTIIQKGGQSWADVLIEAGK